jgi:glycine dehydrogenase
MASTLADALNKLGVIKQTTAFFDTIVVKADAQKLKAIAEKNEINFFYIDDETISISLNETILFTADISDCCFAEALGKEAFEYRIHIENNYQRCFQNNRFLKHDVFNHPF